VFTHKASFGGGDVKLLAALGLFLGVEKGLLCLLVACVVSILFMMARCMSRRIRTYITERKLVYANELTSEEIEETLQPIRCTSKRVAGFLQDTMPFAPFICLGFFVTLLV
jgi:leader peptidase (prepilin peptidase)/N-methyltransferase